MSQLTSALLQTPLEIRHEIYSYILPPKIHVHLSDGKLCSKICWKQDWKEWGCGHERSRGESTAGWARRLQSSWGPHWMCEEGVKKKNMLDTPILLICRQMYTEVVDVTSRTAVVQINHLETLYSLSQWDPIQDRANLDNFSTTLQRSITRLDITMRLPLEFFQSLEEIQEQPTVVPEAADQISATVNLWKQLAPMLSGFSTLTRLSIWLDHSHSCTWSMVNECKLLSDILTWLATTDINVSIILPNLHPLYEREDRHLMEKQLGRSIQLHRTLRQRYHVHEVGPGVGEIFFKPDFPLYYDLQDAEEGSLGEFEAIERRQWKEGVDVELGYRDLVNHRNVYHPDPIQYTV